jgi:hypothetical protein
MHLIGATCLGVLVVTGLLVLMICDEIDIFFDECTKYCDERLQGEGGG